MAKHAAARRSIARRRPRSGRSFAAVAATTTMCGLLSPPPGPSTSDAFTPPSAHHPHRCRRAPSSSSAVGMFAPPGSGYVRKNEATDEDAALSHPELTAADISAISPQAFPDTYEPMLEYPGTMRPGRTPENMPYHDLPGMNAEDNDPVPWPHFQVRGHRSHAREKNKSKRRKCAPLTYTSLAPIELALLYTTIASNSESATTITRRITPTTPSVSHAQTINRKSR